MAATNPDSLSLRMPLEEWFDRYQYTGTSNIGETAVTSISLSDFPVSVEDVWQLPLCYGHHQGPPELREAIAAGYPGLTADDIIVTTGASEAIVLLATVLLEGRSARALNRAPHLPTMCLVPRALSAIDLLRLRPEQQWRPDFVELVDGHRGRRVSGLDPPNHPTGSTISSEELEAAVEIRQSAGVRLVSDETYGLMTEGEPLPPAACVDPTAVSLSTMSKTFGLPGIRIGWITTRDADLMHRLLAAREHITITNNVLGEYIALQVQRDPELFLARARARVAENRAIVADVIENNPRLDWIPPTTGVVQDHPTANIGLGTRVSFHVVDLVAKQRPACWNKCDLGGNRCKDLL